MNVRFIEKDKLRQAAQSFQKEFNLPKHVPTPIENIAEFGFEIDIIPIPGLERAFDIVGFISKDLTEIRVDEHVYHHQQGRYRFTLAHELSHAYLHRTIFENADFDDADSWKNFATSGIGEADYARMEFQADYLAGLILVPETPLRRQFNLAIKKARATGLDVYVEREHAMNYIARHLSNEDIFNVSQKTVEIRISEDSLFDLS